MAAMLQLENVFTHYGAICAVNDVSLEVHQGEIVTLIGCNGAGKTSLLMTLCGTPRASSGRVVYEGEDITQLPTHLIMRKGIAISPEYINEIRGNSFPDNRRFGVLWMDRDALAGLLDMRDGCNDITVSLAPGASQSEVIRQLDLVLAGYGGLGAIGRADQLSHQFIANELAQTRVSATVLPAIFLGVTAFLIHNVLLRLTALQRAQIGLLKSFGYSSTRVGLHFLQFAMATVVIGAVAGMVLSATMISKSPSYV